MKRASCARIAVCVAGLLLVAAETRAQEAQAGAEVPAVDVAAPQTPPVPEALEVEIREPPQPPDAETMTRAETRLLPGAFGDPFRAIETLPGIAPIASGVPYFYVRGSPPGNVGYFLDGIRVPLLFHLGLGPSVVHPALIERVELHPGGVAEYGRFAGGVVSADLAEPLDRVHGEANLRVVDVGALLEVPFDEGKGSALVAGRYSYTGALFSLLQSDTSLAYWDYAARVTYEVAPGHRLGIFGFGAYDFLGEQVDEDGDGETEEKILFDTTFHRIDVRYDQKESEATRLRHDVILGWDQTRLDFGRDVIDRLLAFRTRAAHAFDEDLEVRGGGDITIDEYEADLTRPGSDEDGFAEFFTSHVDVAVGGFVELAMRLGGRLELVPSVRFDLFNSDGDVALAIDPRVSARLGLTPALALITSNGLSSQMPSFIVAGPGFRPALGRGPLQRNFMSSAGVEWKPDTTWTFKAVVYRATFFEINDALGTSALSGEGFPDGFDRFDERFDGTSTGMELSARRRLTRSLGAVLSYSLGRSERYGSMGERVPSGFDRTHVASAALTYDFGAGFRGGLRSLFYTGAPIIRRPEGEPILVKERLPPFFRTDWRFEKRFSIAETGFISIVAEMQNTFLAEETIGEDCRGGIFEPLVCGPEVIGPVVIPSLGVEGGF